MFLNTTSTVREAPFPYLNIPFDMKYYHYETPSREERMYTSNTQTVAKKHEPDDCGLEDLMAQKEEIILSKAHMLLSEIYHRYTLKEDNLYKIDLDQCTCRNLIYLLGDDITDKRRIELERQIIGLEQEKRKEKGNCFRDILFLKKELRYATIEKLEEDQKTALLTNKMEDLK